MKKLAILIAALVAPSTALMAAPVTLTGDDGFGASSFNSAGAWSNGLAPSAGNDYFTGAFRIRTPADAGEYTFGGDSLSIEPSADPLKGLSYKGTGVGAEKITVNNLILNGGKINHLNAVAHTFNLHGNINVLANSALHAKQGPINISSAISGSASLTVQAPDNPADAGREVNFLSPANTFTGNLINDGRFVLADDGVLNFVIGAAGVNNNVTGAGTLTTFNGDFAFNLTGASATLGDTWTIANVAGQTFGDTFSVQGFADLGGNLWQASANGAAYQFSEATGALSVVPIPEPASLALLSFGALALLRRR